MPSYWAVYISDDVFPIALFNEEEDAKYFARSYNSFNPEIIEVNLSVAHPVLDRSFGQD